MSFTQCCMCLQIIHRSFGLVLHLLFQVSINVIGQYILQLHEGINRYNNGVPGNSLLTFFAVRGHMYEYLYLTSEPALAYGSSGLVWCIVFNATFKNFSAIS
jgi:hypothetical protein